VGNVREQFCHASPALPARYKLEIICLLNGKLEWLRPYQQLGDIGSGAPIERLYVHAIRHKASYLNIRFENEHGWKAIMNGQISYLFVMRCEERT
jgi:hypothetical protein